MALAKIALTAAAIAATGIGLSATAHAEPEYLQFTSPSGNIKCEMTISYKGDPYANCVVRHAAYAVPAGMRFHRFGQSADRTHTGRYAEVSCVVAS